MRPETRDGPVGEVAPAKVNLFLHLTGKRPDGYHLLDSLVVFAGAGDCLTVAPSDRLTLELVGPMAATLFDEPDNLVLRAARVLAAAAGVAPRGALRLEKHLPVASGIGGGSADAAAALRLLARFWGVSADLTALAAGLGADVPVCVGSGPTRMGGIGERLDPAPRLPPFGLLLANPGLPVATAAVFRARTGPFGAAALLPEGWADAPALARDLADCRNDLEAPAVAICPGIGVLLGRLRALPGCLLARMSGSGATCFALFATPAAAAGQAARLAGTVAWCWGGAPHHRS